MKLGDWLRRNGVKRADFARRIGVSPGAVTLICREGRAWLSRETAERIVAETAGAVTPNDFLLAAPKGPKGHTMHAPRHGRHRSLRPGRNRCRHRRRRSRERGRPDRRGLALHDGEDGLHHPQHLRHRLRAADRGRRAPIAPRSDGGFERGAAWHRLHRFGRRQTRHDDRHFCRAALQHRACARERQHGRERFRSPGPCVPAGRQGRRRPDALGPYRSRRRSLQARRAAPGRGDLRTRQRRRHGDGRAANRGLRRQA